MIIVWFGFFLDKTFPLAQGLNLYMKISMKQQDYPKLI